MLYRPLWSVALMYSAGVAAARMIAWPLEWLLSLFALSLAAAVLLPRARSWTLPLALFAAGAACFTGRMAAVSPVDLRVIAAGKPELVTLRGRLLEPPVQRVYQRDEAGESWRTHALLRVESISRHGTTQQACGDVAVTSPGRLTAGFFAGRAVEVFGILRPPRGATAPGFFDYRAYLATRRIHFELRTQEPGDWRLVDSSATVPWVERFSAWAQRVLQRGLPVEDEPLRLTWAMALGWKTALTDEVSESFMRTGTMHIFAISGLHVAFIAGVLVALLRVVRLPRSACGVVAIPLIWFYTAATGWQSSAIRSTLMMTVILVGWALRRPGDLLNSLGAAAFCILVWQPEQLFQASFQLSFFVVLSLALLVPPIQRRLEPVLAPDPFLPRELRPVWRQRLDAPLRWLLLSFATSLAAWLGSLPLTAYYFQLLTPVSLVANLAIVPLSSLALACNLGSLLCGDWLPWLGELFNHAGWGLMASMSLLSDWFASWPGAFWNVPAPSVGAMLFYYAVLVALFSGWIWQQHRWRWGIPAFLVCGAGLWLLEALPGRNEVRITVLPLGGGEAIWIDAPGREDDCLIDCGDEHQAEHNLRPFLRAQGINRLPRIVLTHGDVRSVGGWRRIAHEFSPSQTVTGPGPFRSSAYRQVLRELQLRPGQHRVARRGDRLGHWRVLHPAAGDTFDQADDGALVLFGEYDGVQVLLLSDLGREGQRLLMEREPGLHAHIVVAGLPAKGEPVAPELLARLQPQVLVVTDSEFPSTQRAGKPLRERLGNSGIPAVFCSSEGALKLTLSRGAWRIENVSGGILARNP